MNNNIHPAISHLAARPTAANNAWAPPQQGPVDGMGGSVPQIPGLMQPPVNFGVQQPQQPVGPQTYPSGLQLMKDQAGVAFQAVLPAGPLLPVRIAVSSGLDGAVSAQAEMNGQATPLAAQRGTDGKVYVQVDPNNPNLVTFDPSSAEYGVSGPFGWDGQQTTRQHAQTIAPDGTKISVFNEKTGPDGVKNYTRIYENPKGQVWGAQVTETPAAPQQQGGLLQQAGKMLGVGGRNAVQEAPLTVTGNGQKGYDVKGGSMLDYGKGSLKGGFDGIFDWKQAPVQRWLRGRKQEELHLMPFSAAGAGQLFPSLLQGVRP